MMVILALVCLFACSADVPVRVRTEHIFYLHGRIVEEQGKDAFSEQFGKYELDSIVTALQGSNAVVYAQVRPANTDPVDYAQHLSRQIDSLIASGVAPGSVAVVGASKGAIIASEVSTISQHAISYVLLGGNSDYIEQHNDWIFTGRVLAIYDKSDRIAGKDYTYWISRSKASTFQQVNIDSGLGHGFLYKPLEAWLEPTRQWIVGQ